MADKASSSVLHLQAVMILPSRDTRHSTTILQFEHCTYNYIKSKLCSKSTVHRTVLYLSYGVNVFFRVSFSNVSLIFPINVLARQVIEKNVPLFKCHRGNDLFISNCICIRNKDYMYNSVLTKIHFNVSINKENQFANLFLSQVAK